VASVLAPVVAPLAPVIAPIAQVIAPVIAPVASVLAPVTTPLAPVLGPVIAPVAAVLPPLNTVLPTITNPTTPNEWVEAPSAAVPPKATYAAPAAAKPSAPSAATTSTPSLGNATTPATKAPSTTPSVTAAGPQRDASAPLWTTPSLVGWDAGSQLDKLAAAVASGSPAPTASANGVTRPGGGGGIPGSPPGAPCSAAGSAGSAGGLSTGSWAAVGVSPTACFPAPTLRPHRPSLALWRPMVFVSLQERPG
jgi:hypothetical protein